MAAVIDLVAYTSRLEELQNDLQLTFETKLNAINAVVQQISWYGFNPDIYLKEIGDISFSGLSSVSELLQNTVFTPIAQQKLFDANFISQKTHIYSSSEIEELESKLVNLLSIAGEGELKNIIGVLLPAAQRDYLISGQAKSDGNLLNRLIALQNIYSSDDQIGNLNFLQQRHDIKVVDRNRNIFTELFSMAQQNIQWAIKQGVSIEELHADFTIKYCQLSVDMTAANIAIYKADMEANLAEFESKINKQKQVLDVEQLKLKKESTEWGLLVSQANNRLNEYVQSYANAANVNLKLLEGRINGSSYVTKGYMDILSSYSNQFAGISRGSQSE